MISIQTDKVALTSLLPEQTFSRWAENAVARMESGSLLVAVQDVEKLITPTFFMTPDGGVSATTRDGIASAILFLRYQKQVFAMPQKVSATFTSVAGAGWKCELPVGLGTVGRKRVQLDCLWSDHIPWDGPCLKVVLQPEVIALLDSADVIAPTGEITAKISLVKFCGNRCSPQRKTNADGPHPLI